MNGFLNSVVLDRGLFWLVSRTTRLTLTAALADTWEAADACIGFRDLPIVVGPSNYGTSGRQVIVDPIEDGEVVLDGTVAHWALLDDIAKNCLASGNVANPLSVLIGNAFTLTSFSVIIEPQNIVVGLPDVAVV